LRGRGLLTFLGGPGLVPARLEVARALRVGKNLQRREEIEEEEEEDEEEERGKCTRL